MSDKTIEPRTAYRGLTVYRTEAGAVEIDLSDNTNLFGSAPSAVASLREWANTSPARYPSLATAGLRDAIAGWLGIEPDELLPGCGSNDVLDAAMRAFVEPGSRLAFTSPTFVMTSHFAAANSLVPVAVPHLQSGDPDVEGLLATNAPLIYVATPNNPSGTAATRPAIQALLDRAPGFVILDEAYTEFAGTSWAKEAVTRGNVLVTRTFSKVWGLAGLRLGYGVGSKAMVNELEKARGPYKVNAVAEQAAAAAVRQDQAWLRATIAAVAGARDRLVQELRRLGFAPHHSDANFICLPVADAQAAGRFLQSRGIGVRVFANTPVLGDVLRITVGPDPMMAALLRALMELPR